MALPRDLPETDAESHLQDAVIASTQLVPDQSDDSEAETNAAEQARDDAGENE